MIRHSIACLSLLIAFAAGGTARAAESEPTSQLGPDQLEFYLFQAFNSPLQEERYRLNHIGIEGQQVHGGFLVSSVLQGYPAHNAGITRGDIIVTADGEPFHPVHSFNDPSLSPAEHIAQSRTFDLELRRNQQELVISITPVFENLYDSYRIATSNSVQEFSSGNKIIGYIQLWALSRNSDSLFTLQRLISGLDNSDGIIVDLRGSYGFLDREQFKLFTPGEPELDLSAIPGWLSDWHRPSYPITIQSYRKPIVLLIDRSTRAAAELLALELDDAERISSLGSQTAGLFGEIQLEPDRLTYSPATDFAANGLQLESSGVEPEQYVEFPFSESRRDDPQFETAVSWLLGVI